MVSFVLVLVLMFLWRCRDSSSEDEDEKVFVSKKNRQGSNRKSGFEDAGLLSDGYDADFYGDSEDKARLFAMTEVEREAILYERAQVRQARQERRALEQRIREREEASSGGLVGKRAPTKEVDLKRKKLDELKAKRQKRSIQEEEEEEEGEFEDEDEDEQEESSMDEEDRETLLRRQRRQKKKQQQQLRKRSQDSDEDYYTGSSAEEEDQKKRKGKDVTRSRAKEEYEQETEEEFDLDLANKLRLSRDIISQWIYRDGFEDIANRCLLRVNLGAGKSGEVVYRIVELRKLVPYHRTYSIKPGTPTSLAASVRFAKDERTFTFEFLSNSPFTESEFAHWKRECERASVRLPYTAISARRKIQKLKAFHGEALTDSMIASMIERRRELLDAQAAPRNLLAEQTILQQQLKEALERSNTDEVARIEAELATIAHKRQQSESVDRLAVMQDLNRRNRQANLETGRQAEITRMQTELQATTNSPFSSSTTTTLDPFQRRKCKPSIIDMNSPVEAPITTPAKEEESIPIIEDVKEAETKVEEKKTDLFDAHNFDLELDI